MEETSQGDTTEFDDLRYRISQLEHLFITQNLNTTSSSSQANNSHNSSSNNNNSTAHSACCCTNSSINQGLVERSSQLESLLAASELDNSRLSERIALLKADQNRDHVEYLEILKGKDKEIEGLKYMQQLLQGQSDKYKRRFENVKEYINTLPSNEELEEAKRTIEKLETDNNLLNDKASRLESKVLSLQQELFTKESQYQDILARLEELKPLEKAQENYLKDDKLLQKLCVSNKKELSEFLTVQRAQLERSKEVVNSYREKLHKLNEEKNQYVTKIYSQSTVIKNSQDQLVAYKLEIDKLSERVQTLEQEKLKLLNQCESLQELVTTNEQFQRTRDEQLGNIIKLVMEIDLCVFEMGKSVELSQRICSGEELGADDVIGISDFDFHVDILCDNENDDGDRAYSSQSEDEPLSSSSTSSGASRHQKHGRNNNAAYLEKSSNQDADVDSEWVLKRWEKVRQLRKDLAALRSQLNNFYIKKLSDSVEGCPVQ